MILLQAHNESSVSLQRDEIEDWIIHKSYLLHSPHHAHTCTHLHYFNGSELVFDALGL